MKKILMLVVALTAVGSVNVSGQEVTIEAVAMRSQGPFITFRTRNETSRIISSWRADLQVLNSFGDVLWEDQLLFQEEGDIPPMGADVRDHWMNPRYEKMAPAQRLVDYQFSTLRFVWTDIQVAYRN